MKEINSLVRVLFHRFIPVLLFCPAVFAFAEPQVLSNIAKSTSLSNGVEILSGKAAVRITALRDDIIRVRISPNGSFSPDHSWAVQPEMIRDTAKVTPLGGGRSGFKTAQLCVEVDRNPLRIIFADNNGPNTVAGLLAKTHYLLRRRIQGL